MTKTLHYWYMGENGTILSPVKLPDIYCIKKYKISADSNCKITKDGKHFHSVVVVPESEADLWYEVKGQE